MEEGTVRVLSNLPRWGDQESGVSRIPEEKEIFL